jgi:hypothetical protein
VQVNAANEDNLHISRVKKSPTTTRVSETLEASVPTQCIYADHTVGLQARTHPNLDFTNGSILSQLKRSDTDTYLVVGTI